MNHEEIRATQRLKKDLEKQGTKKLIVGFVLGLSVATVVVSLYFASVIHKMYLGV